MSPHGTLSRYKNGKCRCEACKAARAAYERDSGANRRVGRRAEQKRSADHKRDREQRGTCAGCGAPMGIGVLHDGLCASCRSERCHRTRLRICELWAAGYSLNQIRDELGWTKGHVAAEIARMRAAGYDMPHRYRRSTA